MEKKEKIVLIAISVLIVLIIILGLVIIIINNSSKDQYSKTNEDRVFTPTQGEGVVFNIEKVKNATKFFTVEKCIKDFLNQENSEFIALKMDVIYSTEVENYRVYGMLKNDGKETECYYIVRIDIKNFTYEIEECKGDYDSLEDVTLEENNKEIKPDGQNEFEYLRISEEDICRKYLYYYNSLLLNNPNKAYEMLDNEYKFVRFSSNMDEFNKYIQNNKETIEKSILSGYSIEEDDYTTYVLKDAYEHYYVLKEDSIMNFTIKLDTYSIKDDEFKKKYNSLKEAEKTSANLGLFIQMINNKDYSHAYEKLSTGFKNNYFKTQEDFENYVKSKWYNALGYEIGRYSNEGNIYIYEITLKNLRGKEIQTMEQTFNIRLNEEDNTNYEISFKVE